MSIRQVTAAQLDLVSALDSVYEAYCSRRDLSKILEEDRIEPRLLTGPEDLLKEGLYRARINILSISGELLYLPLKLSLKCTRCENQVDVNPVAIPELAKNMRCPSCGGPMVPIDMKVVPARRCHVQLLFGDDNIVDTTLCEGTIIGTAIKKAHGGYTEAIIYPVLRHETKKDDYFLKVKLLILDILESSEEARLGTVIEKLLKCGTVNVYGSVLENLELIDSRSIIPFTVTDMDKYLAVLVKSFAPDVFGLLAESLALLCSLVGGYSDLLDRSKKWWINVLMIGDPSAGKSTLTSHLMQTAPRILLLTADFATKVSLLAAEDVHTKTINPGPLTMMDGDYTNFGTVLVEQIETWNPSIIMALRDVFERGEAGRPVRGIHYRFRTRCSFIATSNWRKGVTHVDKTNFMDALPDPVSDLVDLSRFDIVLIFFAPEGAMLQEIAVAKWFKKISKPVLTKSELRTLILRARQIVPRLGTDVDEKFIRDLVADMESRYREYGLKPLPRIVTDNLMRLSAALAKLTFSTVIRRKHIELAYRMILSQFEKLDLNIPAIPPHLLEIHPSKRALMERIYDMVQTFCCPNGCDMDELLRKFKDVVETMVQNGKISQAELNKITGGNIAKFFEKTIEKLHDEGLIVKNGNIIKPIVCKDRK